MKYLIFLFSFSALLAQKTPFEKGNGNQSTTYEECIAFYKNLEINNKSIKIIDVGLTDSGENLQIVLFNPDNQFELDKIKKEKAIILINNGIHPGEPDGIDASMMVLRDLVTAKIKAPKNTVIAIIPIYNIGGMINRNSNSRANQNGPEAYGFRGNARNFDLNRDFIKSDSKNSRSFQSLFHMLNPDIFIDNHVSNGADYQYTFTCIATNKQRLGGELGQFYHQEMHPSIVKYLKNKKIESTPYVNIHGDKPDNGFSQFMDSPRYATGYTSLFNTIGSVPETHMLKDFSSRVKVTYEYMLSTINFVDKHYLVIKKLRLDNLTNYKSGNSYPIHWEIDSSKVTYFSFKGFEGNYKKSEISGQSRLYYDRKKPFTKDIPFYSDYKPTKEIIIPEYYVVPKSEWPILELLTLNDIEMSTLKKDTIIAVEHYQISDYETTKYPYEGHYAHFNLKVNKKFEKLSFRKGDFLISTNQLGVKYLLETLEPEAVDSYFNWNYFDAILQQKEYFSAYVFEDLAFDILQKNPKLKAEFETLRKENKSFSENGTAQLDWIYKHSEYYEKAHLKYPIYRIQLPKKE